MEMNSKPSGILLAVVIITAILTVVDIIALVLFSIKLDRRLHARPSSVQLPVAAPAVEAQVLPVAVPTPSVSPVSPPTLKVPIDESAVFRRILAKKPEKQIIETIALPVPSRAQILKTASFSTLPREQEIVIHEIVQEEEGEGEEEEEGPLSEDGTGIEGVSWVNIQPEPVAQTFTTSDQHSIVIATYNVRCDKDHSPHTWKEREPSVLRTMMEADADVICLQEAKQKFARNLVRKMKSIWNFSGQARKRNDEGTQILFRSDTMCMLNSFTFVLGDDGASPCPPSTACTTRSTFNGKKCKHVRIFTHTQLMHRRTGKIINVLNVHFPLEDGEQMVCAAVLGSYVSDNISQAESVVVCGDFNSHYAPHDKNTPLSRLMQIGQLDDAHGMEDFSTYEEGFKTKDLELSQNHRLDYILYREGGGMFKFDAADMMNSRCGLNDCFRPSDHELLRVAFLLQRD